LREYTKRFFEAPVGRAFPGLLVVYGGKVV
jgi:hypothetical protein